MIYIDVKYIILKGEFMSVATTYYTNPQSLESRDVNFTKILLKELSFSQDIEDYNKILSPFGFFLLRAKNKNDQDRALQKLSQLLDKAVNNEYEERKNSRANKIINAIQNRDYKTIASTIASAYRTFLSDCCIEKAQKSVYGYTLNGNNRIKTCKPKEIIALCEWCNQEIIVQLNKGYSCPLCGVFFQDYKPNKIKIDLVTMAWYEENYDDLTLIESIQRGELSILKIKYSKSLQLTLF